jgi:hypothetical protein
VNLKSFSLMLAATAVLANSGCSSSKQITEQTPAHNLVALFVVTQDNLTNEYRGEIYPLALSIEGRYVDVSNDVTQAVRTQNLPDRIIQLEEPRSFLSAIKTFTVIDQNKPQGKFTVDRLAIAQYTCSSLITGQGSYEGTALPTLLARIPENLGGRFRQVRVAGAPFDETRRFAIALSSIATSQDSVTTSPAMIPNEVIKQQLGGKSRSELVGTADLDGDGIEEVILKDRGYETSSFSIYEYKNNRLNRVFTGAGYGC